MSIPAKTIAVTGAGGFVGSALVRALINAGHSVRALLGPPQASFQVFPASVVEMTGQITEEQVMLTLAEGAEMLIHLAGPPSVAVSFEQPTEYARIHILGTINVLRACYISRIPHLIYLSSAEVYGRPQRNPVGEDHPVFARSPYGACKIAAEQFIRAHALSYGLDVTIFRPFSVYGPGMSSLSLIGSLVRQIACGDSISVQDLRPIRDYCYIDDVVNAIELTCAHAERGIRTFNIGSGQGFPVSDIAGMLVNTVGRKISIRECWSARRPGQSDILELVADIRNIKTALNWNPSIALAEGLQRLAVSENLLE